METENDDGDDDEEGEAIEFESEDEDENEDEWSDVEDEHEENTQENEEVARQRAALNLLPGVAKMPVNGHDEEVESEPDLDDEAMFQLDEVRLLSGLAESCFC